ncbi:hypothetical protein Afil01_36090 [Actinorhabdospora filicis]|uniref:QacE family quaternary ammonium compound efflux SMR transporter n=1 Tax=Actinorhabdospora filicis TaxID=1785913 RepID=A0A9W6W425_9ACTN|nr:SMR family transporter [Actinorhabdospora filicis]GLZ78802.1 hypothetical protein Afil01_36090 [Actinorhabdospora filicis]
MPWVLLAVAVVGEVAATLSLRALAGGFRPMLLAAVLVGYGVSFTLIGIALRSLNVGVVYAIWSGVGTAGVAVAAWWLFSERLNWTAAAGMALIVAGVVVLVSSGAAGHG